MLQKKITNYVQIAVSSAVLITIGGVVVALLNSVSMDTAGKQIAVLLISAMVSLSGIILLREMKIFRRKQDADKGEIAAVYIGTIIIVGLLTARLMFGYEFLSFSTLDQTAWLDKPYILIGACVLASIINYRYGAASVLIGAAVIACGTFSLSSYFLALGYLATIPLAVLFVHFIFFMKWSNFRKKKPGLEVVK